MGKRPAEFFILKDRAPEVPADVSIGAAWRREDIEALVFLEVSDSPRIDAPEVHLPGFKSQPERELVRKHSKDDGIEPGARRVEVVRIPGDAHIFVRFPLIEPEGPCPHGIAIEVHCPPVRCLAIEDVSWHIPIIQLLRAGE